MSVGKIAAQVGHAVHEAVCSAQYRDLRKWEDDDAKKVTLEVSSEEQMKALKKEAKKIGVSASIIRDAGYTEVSRFTVVRSTVVNVTSGKSPCHFVQNQMVIFLYVM